MYRLLNGDCLNVMGHLMDDDEYFNTIFMDPPDNIGLDYDTYEDDKTYNDYIIFLRDVVSRSCHLANTIWISFNSKWLLEMAEICATIVNNTGMQFKPCVQTFTFGQHRKTDFGNNHRPLWRLQNENARFYPDEIMVQSERQRIGDKRANPKGRVPGDVFDFSRVVGNSKQRRKWHKTQLNEGLVERCILSCTPDDGKVLDLFSGTGTTLRVCKRLGISCTSIELSELYCKKIAKDNQLKFDSDEFLWYD